MSYVDLSSPEVVSDPYPIYAELRRRGPAVQVDPEGMWAVTRFSDVVQVLRRVDAFSSAPGEGDREQLFEKAFGGPNIIGADNPTHDRLRYIMQGRFTPKHLARLQRRGGGAPPDPPGPRSVSLRPTWQAWQIGAAGSRPTT